MEETQTKPKQDKPMKKQTTETWTQTKTEARTTMKTTSA